MLEPRVFWHVRRWEGAALAVLAAIGGVLLIGGAVTYASTRSGISREVVSATATTLALAFSCLSVASTLRLLAVRRVERHALPIALTTAVLGLVVLGFGLHLLATRLIANGYTVTLVARVASPLGIGTTALALSAVLRGTLGIASARPLQAVDEGVGEAGRCEGVAMEEQGRLDQLEFHQRERAR